MTDSDSDTGERRRFRRTNEMLAARVCVEIDENAVHTGEIQVFADADHVTLRGVALHSEVKDVLISASGVPGVNVVSNQLEVRDTPGKIIALQG
jgi:hypothetical protein